MDAFLRLLRYATPHRAVILDANLGSVGIGATTSPDGRIWITVHFGGAA